MKLYNSYIKKSQNESVEDLILLKEGFSLNAFIFNLIWFLYHRMWRWSLIILATNVLFVVISESLHINNYNSFIFSFGFSSIIAINANYLYGRYLNRKGYEFLGCVFGKNEEEAKIAFIQNYYKKNRKSHGLLVKAVLKSEKELQKKPNFLQKCFS